MGSVPKTKKKNLPKSISEMSQETLQETLKKKRECNVKALQTVEKLCETCVEEEWFLANLQFINQCHFDDITIERSITKICGYPLCNQKLEKIPSQQYHISTRYNKVFDITERKNFCSSCCYKSAMHVKKQLFTSPLWFRDQETIPKYTVLKTMKSSLGEEVVFLPDKIKSDEDEPKHKNVNSVKPALNKSIEELEKKYSSLSVTNSEKNNVEVETKIVENNSCGVQKEIKEKSVEEKDLKSVKEPKIEKVKETNSTSLEENFKKAKPDKVENNKPKNKTGDEPLSVIQKVEKSIFEWFSLDTFFYLYGEQKLKELLQDKAEAVKEIINSKLSLAGRNEKINRMIQLYGLLDSDLFSNSETKANLKPLPDYSILKEEGKNLEIKVRAFYQGDLQIKQPAKEEKKEEEETNPDTQPNYLPLIDAHAQTSLRKKIVLDKLNRVLPELMKIFNSDYALQMNEVRNLVSTFVLSAHNITFKPAVWWLVGIILIKLLSIKDKNLESVLKSESAGSQVLVILTNYELQKDYLDNLIVRLTDSGSLMEKLNEVNR